MRHARCLRLRRTPGKEDICNCPFRCIFDSAGEGVSRLGVKGCYHYCKAWEVQRPMHHQSSLRRLLQEALLSLQLGLPLTRELNAWRWGVAAQ